MARFNRPPRPSPGGPPVPLGVVVAIGLLLAGVPMLLLNQQHSGDPLKIRRELRKF
ncbi:hypothetical protein [Cyanobium gracile]|uniref:Uncharacterized protein n=1 Tax=Cyanobium gracile (strain ATCC 27147 / PCC 6307) TaxID=292564 RepID=K9P667_CYAGP|nr:hypothetical protein [Cyanobium gracile]AFY28872.1 hypothetical protein Cyagr_1724 [Cyanobium gracile PCC 6307]